jgi:hypothetical protein
MMWWECEKNKKVNYHGDRFSGHVGVDKLINPFWLYEHVGGVHLVLSFELQKKLYDVYSQLDSRW